MSSFHCNECNEEHVLNPEPPEDEYINEPLSYQFLVTNNGIFVVTNRKMTDSESTKFSLAVDAMSKGAIALVEDGMVIDGRTYPEFHHHHDEE